MSKFVRRILSLPSILTSVIVLTGSAVCAESSLSLSPSPSQALSPSPSQAGPPSPSPRGLAVSMVILESPEELDFEPREAALVAGFDTGEILSVVAAIIPPQRMARDSSDVSRWWLAAPVRIPVGARHVTWIGRVVSPSGLVSFIGPRDRPLLNVDGVPQLRGEVSQLSSQVGASAKQLITLEKEMKRLRNEAELIGNFGRIIDAQEELNRTEQQLSQLADQSVSVEQFLSKAQNFSVPRSPAAREQQLTREIATIAEATQKAERSELLRKVSSEREAKRMMSALDEARAIEAQDPGFLKALKAEFSRLVALREQIEVSSSQ